MERMMFLVVDIDLAANRRWRLWIFELIAKIKTLAQRYGLNLKLYLPLALLGYLLGVTAELWLIPVNGRPNFEIYALTQGLAYILFWGYPALKLGPKIVVRIARQPRYVALAVWLFLILLLVAQ